jgi:hypothetical protein
MIAAIVLSICLILLGLTGRAARLGAAQLL